MTFAEFDGCGIEKSPLMLTSSTSIAMFGTQGVAIVTIGTAGTSHRPS